MENSNIDYSRHYKNWHSDTEEHINKMNVLYSKIISEHFPPGKNISILDIGCGMGFLMVALKKAGYENICGIDTDEQQVISCKQKNLEVTLVKDSAGFLKENAGSYDLVTAFDVLEHIPASNQIDFVKAIYGSLKPGGVFIAAVPNANSVLASRNRYIDHTHHVLFTEVSLDFVLYNGGFREIEIKPLDYIVPSASLRSFLHRILLRYFRFRRRLEMIAELGTTWGKKIPLSFNIISRAIKK
jgi:2-polyprenyl-3-methyl-5-hydroxy-6-metoxy-1,4-benzoquinol methylase